MSPLNATTLLVLALFALPGCASTGIKTDGSATRTSSSDYVTSIEINATSASNAYELISRLRPQWLQAGRAGSLSGGMRTQIVAVYMDGVRIAERDGLRSISASGIKTMQYYDAARAATLLRDTGSEPLAGAIVITSTKIQ